MCYSVQLNEELTKNSFILFFLDATFLSENSKKSRLVCGIIHKWYIGLRNWSWI